MEPLLFSDDPSSEIEAQRTLGTGAVLASRGHLSTLAASQESA